jgi:N-acetyltransferase 10
MGYGSRAIDLIIQYFQGDLSTSILPGVGLFGGEGAEDESFSRAVSADDGADNEIKPRTKLPPLLTLLRDRPAEQLHWLGVSFGLTTQLLNFWSRKAFKVCYVRQTTNDLTGEHSCVVLRELNCDGMLAQDLPVNVTVPREGWLNAYMHDYRRRLVSLLSYSFNKLETVLAMTLVDPEKQLTSAQEGESLNPLVGGDDLPLTASPSSLLGLSQLPPLTAQELLTSHFSHHDLQRLELYSRNMVDHHMIIDLLPSLSKFGFLGRLRGFRLSYLQVAILLATGLQHRNVDEVAVELDLPVNQVLAFFNKTIRKVSSYLKAMVEAHVAASGSSSDAVLQRMERKASSMVSLKETLKADHKEEESDFKRQQREVIMKSKDISRHAITAGIEELGDAMEKAVKKQKDIPKAISVAKVEKSVYVLPPLTDEDLVEEQGDNVDNVAAEEVDTSKSHKKRHRSDKETPSIDGTEGLGIEQEKVEKHKKKKKNHKDQ